MVRDFQINGPCMVEVKGGAQYSGRQVGNIAELGLASEPIRVIPTFYHKDVKVDDFGPNVPAEVLFNLADVRIKMTLINVERSVLEICIAEAMGGGPNTGFFGITGILAPAGTPMGGGKPLFASGNHYISLNLSSPTIGSPYRFPTCYLAEQPIEIPLGVGVSAYMLNWRAIPYKSPLVSGGSVFLSGGVALANRSIVEVSSSGAVLWDRLRDV